MAARASKHDVLSEEEMAGFEILHGFRQLIDSGRRQPRAPGRPVFILDWGCGRGQMVAALLAEGHESFGVDIDPEPLENGRHLLANRGHDANDRLRLLAADQPTDFASGRFDLIFSNQVLEHVGDLDAMATEVARLLVPGGISLHLYPGHRRWLEPHLGMPLVRWLSNGRSRDEYIECMVEFGVEPAWQESCDATTARRAATYSAYLRERTHHRPPAKVRRAFRRHGLLTTSWSAAEPEGRWTRWLFAHRWLRPLWEWQGCRFESVWLRAVRPSPR